MNCLELVPCIALYTSENLIMYIGHLYTYSSSDISTTLTRYCFHWEAYLYIENSKKLTELSTFIQISLSRPAIHKFQPRDQAL
jgi:hypothetical protein